VDGVLRMVWAAGGRATTSRRMLIEILFEKDAHLSAEDLTAEVRRRPPDVHLSTVYRNLEELERLGVISHTHLGHGPITYQLAARAHPHLICERCGTRVHVPESLLAGLVRTARKSLGFEIDPGHLSVSVRCADCS
jgi:Fur family ferric uptake transcriptional regulator